VYQVDSSIRVNPQSILTTVLGSGPMDVIAMGLGQHVNLPVSDKGMGDDSSFTWSAGLVRRRLANR